MARPTGLVRTTKNNDNKHPQQREEWMEGKKIGRPKQVWVWDIDPNRRGHWEKVR